MKKYGSSGAKRSRLIASSCSSDPFSTAPLRALSASDANRETRSFPGGQLSSGLSKAAIRPASLARPSTNPVEGSSIKDANVIDVANVQMPFQGKDGRSRLQQGKQVFGFKQSFKPKEAPAQAKAAPSSVNSLLAEGYGARLTGNRLLTSIFHRQCHGQFPTTAEYYKRHRAVIEAARGNKADAPALPPPPGIRSLSRPFRPFTRSIDGMTADMRTLLEKIQPALRNVVLLGFTRKGDGILSYSWEEVEVGFAASSSSFPSSAAAAGFGGLGSTAVKFEMQLWSVVPGWRGLCPSPPSPQGAPNTTSATSTAFGVDLVTTFPLFQEGQAWKDWAREADSDYRAHHHESLQHQQHQRHHQSRGNTASGFATSSDESRSSFSSLSDGMMEGGGLLDDGFSSFEPSQVKVVVWETQEGAFIVQGSLVSGITGSAVQSAPHSARLPRTAHLTVIPPLLDTTTLASLVRLRGVSKAKRAFQEKREVMKSLICSTDDDGDGDDDDGGTGASKPTTTTAADSFVRFAPVPVRPTTTATAAAFDIGGGGGFGGNDGDLGDGGGGSTFGGSLVRCFHTSFALSYPYPSQSVLGMMPLQDEQEAHQQSALYYYRLMLNTGEGLRCITLSMKAVGGAPRSGDSTALTASAATTTSSSTPKPVWWRNLIAPTTKKHQPQPQRRVPAPPASAASSLSSLLLIGRRFPTFWTGAEQGELQRLPLHHHATFGSGGFRRQQQYSTNTTPRQHPIEVQSLYPCLITRRRLLKGRRSDSYDGDEGDEDEDDDDTFFTGDVSIVSAFELEAEPLLARLLSPSPSPSPTAASGASSTSSPSSSSLRVHNYDIRLACLLDDAYARSMGMAIKTAPVTTASENSTTNADDNAENSSSNVETPFDISPLSTSPSSSSLLLSSAARFAIFTIVVDHEVPLAVNAAAAQLAAGKPHQSTSEQGDESAAKEVTKVAEDAFAFQEEQVVPEGKAKDGEGVDVAETSVKQAPAAITVAPSSSTNGGDGWDDVLADSKPLPAPSAAVTAASKATAVAAAKPAAMPATYGGGGGAKRSLGGSTSNGKEEKSKKDYAPPSSAKVRSLFVCSLDVVTGAVRVIESGRVPPALQPAFDDGYHHRGGRSGGKKGPGSRLSDAIAATADSAAGSAILAPRSRPFMRGQQAGAVTLASFFAGQQQHHHRAAAAQRISSAPIPQTIETLSRLACAATRSRLFDLPSLLMNGSSGANEMNGVRQLDNHNMVAASAAASRAARATMNGAAEEDDDEDDSDEEEEEGDGRSSCSRSRSRSATSTSGRSSSAKRGGGAVVGARSLKKLTHPIYPFALVA
jgi:hypothetical protein